MSFVSSKGNILCRLVKIELYKIFAIINRAIKGLHCTFKNVIFEQGHEHFLCNCSQLNANEPHSWLVKVGAIKWQAIS